MKVEFAEKKKVPRIEVAPGQVYLVDGFPRIAVDKDDPDILKTTGLYIGLCPDSGALLSISADYLVEVVSATLVVGK